MPLDHMIIMCTLLKDHVPNFEMLSCDIADIAPVVWLTCEHGTEMGTPSPVLNKHRKLSPVDQWRRKTRTDCQSYPGMLMIVKMFLLD